MNRSFFIMLGSVAVVGVMVWMLNQDGRLARMVGDDDSQAEFGEPLLLFCAASNQAVMEAIRTEYEQEFQRPVDVQYGASQTLLSSLEVSGKGDLFLPADDSYLTLAGQKQLVAEVLPVARMQGVIAVKKGNPKNIQSFQDLIQKKVRLVQANPEAAAIANLTQKILTESKQWDSLDQATVAYRTTVTDVANDLLVDASDAGIVYDAVLHTYPDLEYVEIPELDEVSSQVSIGVIATTKRSQAALHFARYVAAKDRGLKHYADHGFRVAQGDRWVNTPELSIFAGSMLRPAIDHTITAFEKREGVIVDRVYNGCGILVGNMDIAREQGAQQPDVYFACDTEFMNQVHDIFPEPVNVAQNELVILVRKGNPHNIRSLRDLAQEGIDVGIGHENQCAMGWLTQNTFREGGVHAEVMANVKVQVPAGDMLVNEMLAGSLDAAVAYLSNAAGATEKLDAVRIHDIECSVATQPFAISAGSPHAQTASRLFAMICSAESRESFADEGFRWQLPVEDKVPSGDDKQP